MAEALLQTPYSTAMPFIVSAATGGWMDEYDRQRLLSYDLYDDLFHNDPAQYRIMLRSSDEKPIYVPTAKRVVGSLARYVGKGWGYRVLGADPLATEEVVATDEQVAAAQQAFGQLFARERLLSTFRAGIPEWLRRGDWLWMITGDMNKREGRRISVRPIDPRRYFPLFNDPYDVGRITGQELIEEITIGEEIFMFVQTWLKASDPGHPNYEQEEPEEGFEILRSAQAYSLEDFADVDKRKPVNYEGNVAEEYLVGITALPIYHIRNNETSDDPYGRSDLSGLESIVAGINQTITDEDLSLAFMGIGMYWTDSGAPVDETTGQVTNWKLGPKRVIEVGDGKKFGKVDGITSVEPFQDHAAYLKREAQSAVGLSDVSVGTGSVSTASGISLAIQFSPTIDAVKVKNEAINGVMTQMFYDLKEWFVTYEGIDLGPVVVVSEADDDDLMPFDREARWKEIMEGVTAGVFTLGYAVSVLENEFGYEFPAGYVAEVEAAGAAATAALDPFAARTSEELADTEIEDVEAASAITA